RRPKVLPASSTQVLSPPSFMRSSSHARASSWTGLQQDRVMPPPSGFLPKRDSVSMCERSRGSDIARGAAMAAGSIPQRFRSENPAAHAFLTPFDSGPYYDNESPFSARASAAYLRGRVMDFALTPEQASFRDEFRSWLP